MSGRQKHDPRGKVVAITGGARGIGLATAKAFLDAGAVVALGDIDEALAADAAGTIGVSGFQVDISDTASFEAFLDGVERTLGPLDVLVNNAGIMPLGPLPEEPDEVTRRIVSINLVGTIVGTKLAMSRMVPRGTGHIVNVASAVGRVAVSHGATYSATKFGVVGLTEAVRSELFGTGVRASVILPASTNTDLVKGLKQPRGQRVVEPSEVADTILAVVKNPRFETWVPRSAQRSVRALSFLPRPVQEAFMRASGATDGMTHVDRDARAEYEKRARSRTF